MKEIIDKMTIKVKNFCKRQCQEKKTIFMGEVFAGTFNSRL